jgi:hypothetical protein
MSEHFFKRAQICLKLTLFASLLGNVSHARDKLLVHARIELVGGCARAANKILFGNAAIRMRRARSKCVSIALQKDAESKTKAVPRDP